MDSQLIFWPSMLIEGVTESCRVDRIIGFNGYSVRMGRRKIHVRPQANRSVVQIVARRNSTEHASRKTSKIISTETYRKKPTQVD